MSYKPAILDAATELFAQRGFKNTSIAAIAKNSGAAEGTLFHHFRSKEDIFLEVLKLAKGRIIHEVDETINAESLNTGLDHVEAVINTYLYLSEKLHAEFSLLFRGFSYEQAKADAAWRNTLESIYNCFLNALSEGIIIGQEDGSIAADISPPKTAMLVFAMINGLVRIGNSNLFPVDSLYFDVIKNCRKMLT